MHHCLDGTDVRIGEEVVMPCVLEKSDLSAAVTVCENMSFLVVRAGLRCVRYIFCNLPLDFVFGNSADMLYNVSFY